MIHRRLPWIEIALTLLPIFTAVSAIASSPADKPIDTIELEKYIVSERPQGIIPFCFEAVGTSDGAMIVPPVIASRRPAETPLNNRLVSTSHSADNRAFSRHAIRAVLRAKGHDVFAKGTTFENNGPYPPQLSQEGGGQIVAIDGRDINRFTLFTLRDTWFSGEVGDEVKLIVLTGGKSPVFHEISIRRISAKKWKSLWLDHSQTAQPNAAH